MTDHSFLKGTGVALVSPFKADKSIDFNGLTNLVRHVTEGGVDFLVVMGTTGESVVLSSEEKQQVLAHIIKQNDQRLPIILGIGGNDTNQIKRQISEQDFTGISGLLSVCPYYNKPNQKGLYAHFAEIASTSPVPVILYNVPGRTGSWLSPETTIRLAGDFENIVATKEASGQVEQIMKIVALKPDSFVVISGDDALTLPLMSIGVEGVISVAANAFPYLMSSMVKAANKNDYATARKLHYDLQPVFEPLFAEGNPAGVKAILHQLGLMQNELRLPLTPVSDNLFTALSMFSKQLNQGK